MLLRLEDDEERGEKGETGRETENVIIPQLINRNGPREGGFETSEGTGRNYYRNQLILFISISITLTPLGPTLRICIFVSLYFALPAAFTRFTRCRRLENGFHDRFMSRQLKSRARCYTSREGWMVAALFSKSQEIFKARGIGRERPCSPKIRIC